MWVYPNSSQSIRPKRDIEYKYRTKALRLMGFRICPYNITALCYMRDIRFYISIFCIFVELIFVRC